MEEKMKRISKVTVFVLATLFVVLGMSGALQAANYPEKPINLIVPCGAGCGADVLSRAMAVTFQKNKLLPQPFIVENKPGASHAIANAYVASKKKDPYTIVATAPLFITTPLLGGTPITYKDFTCIANLVSEYYMVIVPGNSKYKTAKDFVAAAKANPKQLSFGGSGVASGDFISGHLFAKAAGITLNSISYDGGGQVMAALLGNHLDAGAGTISELLELYKAGKIRILGVLAEKRLDSFPEIPTMKEQGFDAISSIRRGIAAPSDIPADARKILEDSFHKYIESDDFKKYAKENQFTIDWQDGKAFEKWAESASISYLTVLKEMGLIQKK
jgi:putative tricarboxylic transport membrane protein